MNAFSIVNLVIVFVISFSSCKNDELAQDPSECRPHTKAVEENRGKRTISQGLYGTIGRKEGNCMPMIEGSNSTCQTCAVSRTILIHELTGMDDVTGNMPFFESISTPLIAQVDADANGFFQVSLNPGLYSVFILENGNLYANRTGGSSMEYGFNPVEIKANKAVEIALFLDYAVY